MGDTEPDCGAVVETIRIVRALSPSSPKIRELLAVLIQSVYNSVSMVMDGELSEMTYEAFDETTQESRLRWISTVMKSAETTEEQRAFMETFHRVHLYTLCFMQGFEKSLVFLAHLIEMDSSLFGNEYQRLFKYVFACVLGKVISRRAPWHFIKSSVTARDVLERLKSVETFVREGLWQGYEEVVKQSITENGMLDVDRVSGEIWRGLGLSGSLEHRHGPTDTGVEAATLAFRVDAQRRYSSNPPHAYQKAYILKLAQQYVTVRNGMKRAYFIPVDHRKAAVVVSLPEGPNTRDLSSDVVLQQSDLMFGTAGAEMRYGDLDEKTEKLMKLDSLYEIDGIGPIEAHLMRLYFNRSQERVIIDALALMLFPYTPVETSRAKTCQYVKAVYESFANVARLITAERARENHAYRAYWQSVIGPLLLAPYTSIIQNPSDLEPLSSRFMLRRFLVDPVLRMQMPVTYAFLRLSERFDRVRFIGPLMEGITTILQSNGTTTRLRDCLENDECEKFISYWRKASKAVLSDLMTADARTALGSTCKDDPEVGSFLPTSHCSFENWPIANVLLSLSAAHNEFVAILSEHSNVSIEDIEDKSMDCSDRNFIMKGSKLGKELTKTIRGSLDSNGIPVLTEEHERQFIRYLSTGSYFFIIHSSMSNGASSPVIAESLVTQFEQKILPVALDAEQRNSICSEVRDAGKGPGLILLIEKVMFKIISRDDGSRLGQKSLSDYLVCQDQDEGAELADRKALPIEIDAYENGFLNAKSKTSTEFIVAQLPAIHRLLTYGRVRDNVAQTLVSSVLSRIRPTDVGQSTEDVDVMAFHSEELLSNAAGWTILRNALVRFALFRVRENLPTDRCLSETTDQFKQSPFYADMPENERKIFISLVETRIFPTLVVGQLYHLLTAVNKQSYD